MYSKEVREKARTDWLGGKSIAEVAADMKISYATLNYWRVQEQWDAQKDRIEYDAECRALERLTSQREEFQESSLQLWAFLHAQMRLRAVRYGTNTEMPMAEAMDMAKILAACQTGYYLALGIDPRIEARENQAARPRRVLIDYQPLVETLAVEYGELAGGNGHNGNGHSNGNGSNGGSAASFETAADVTDVDSVGEEP